MRFLPSLFLLVILSTFACQAPSIKPPELKEIKNIRVLDVNAKKIAFITDALLYNPNKIGVTLTGAEFDVYIEDELLGVVNQEERAEISGLEEFEFSLKADLNPKALAGDLLGTIGKVLQIISEGEMKVKLDGHFKVELLGKAVRIPFNQEQMVAVGKKQ